MGVSGSLRKKARVEGVLSSKLLPHTEPTIKTGTSGELGKRASVLKNHGPFIICMVTERYHWKDILEAYPLSVVIPPFIPPHCVGEVAGIVGLSAHFQFRVDMPASSREPEFLSTESKMNKQMSSAVSTFSM